jgi:signal transduction histidine kinase
MASNGQVHFGVRDFGPGVPKDQMKKIFELFYRSESELTRETVGTGIGLAIVHQLCLAMGGSVDVVNRNPGAEFVIGFPIHRVPANRP